MKTHKIFLLLLVVGSLLSCSGDDALDEENNELDGLQLITEFSNDTHTVELYSETGSLETGFNELSLRIMEQASGEYLSAAELSWMPVMYMTGMEHAAPASELTKVVGSQHLYSGSIVFTMASNFEEKWELQLTYSADGAEAAVSGWVEVSASETREVISFKGDDGQSYTLALVAPTEPEVAVNELVVALFRMESMMEYEAVEGYTLLLDPRMPGMGSHSSPNNVDLTQGEDGLYYGKLSLTMTGLWEINLQLLNAAGERIAGEEVTESHPRSSIYLELEF